MGIISRYVVLGCACYLLGSFGPRLPLGSPAVSAPVDVFGSGNVAVDTFQNTAGTFVLWADGRITNCETGAVQNGRTAYDAAGTALRDPQLETNHGQGSPNVAVKAICRNDGTYILFADGKLKRPQDPKAKSAAWARKALLFGTTSVPYGTNHEFSYDRAEVDSITRTGGGINYLVHLKHPLPNANMLGFVSVATAEESYVFGIGMAKVDDKTYNIHSTLPPVAGVTALNFIIVSTSPE